MSASISREVGLATTPGHRPTHPTLPNQPVRIAARGNKSWQKKISRNWMIFITPGPKPDSFGSAAFHGGARPHAFGFHDGGAPDTAPPWKAALPGKRVFSHIRRFQPHRSRLFDLCGWCSRRKVQSRIASVAPPSTAARGLMRLDSIMAGFRTPRRRGRRRYRASELFRISVDLNRTGRKSSHIIDIFPHLMSISLSLRITVRWKNMVHRGFVGSGKGNQSFQLWSRCREYATPSKPSHNTRPGWSGYHGGTFPPHIRDEPKIYSLRRWRMEIFFLRIHGTDF